MTAPYLPYSQQNYADWKARFERDSQIGGLLRQAKVAAGLEEEQADRMPPMLQAPPQEQAQMQMPPQVPPAMQAPTPEELHAHEKGIRGGLLHLLGADRQAPEVAALLTPEERERVRPGVLGTLWNAVASNKGPQAVQQERALNIVGLRDAKKAREEMERKEALSRRIEAVAATMDPEVGVEYAARMKAIYGLPDATSATQAAVGLKEREFAPQRIIWTTVPMMVNGSEKMVMRSNDGQLLDASTGEDLRAMGARLEPMPPMAAPNQILPTVNPDGTPGYVAASGRGGEVRTTPLPGVERPVPGAQSRQQVQIINTERSLAYRDAQNSIEALLDANGQMKDPPSNLDRIATQREWTNFVASGSGQAYMSNVRKLIRSWVVLIEGKRMSDADARVNELQRSFSFGDRPEVIESKKRTLLSMAQAIRDLGEQGVELPVPGGEPAAPEGGKTFTLPNGKTFRVP